MHLRNKTKSLIIIILIRQNNCMYLHQTHVYLTLTCRCAHDSYDMRERDNGIRRIMLSLFTFEQPNKKSDTRTNRIG